MRGPLSDRAAKLFEGLRSVDPRRQSEHITVIRRADADPRAVLGVGL
jgi:hypothetical protein